MNVMPQGLSTLAPRILKPRSATDAELCLVHNKAQVAGLKRAAAAAEKSESGVIWLPATGCLGPWDVVRHVKPGTEWCKIGDV